MSSPDLLKSIKFGTAGSNLDNLLVGKAVENGISEQNERMTNAKLIRYLLGISDVPLSLTEMARSLVVTFYPPHSSSPLLHHFAIELERAFRGIGVQVVPVADALKPGTDKIRPGIIAVEQGEAPNGDQAIHRVSSLYQNPLVGIFEGPPPLHEGSGLQETLDAIVGVLAWNLTHIPIFVESDKWTICTMNGAVIRCGNWNDMLQDVLHKLIPKLSAQVVPPKQSELIYRQGLLDVESKELRVHVEDMVRSGPIWASNGLMLAHTSIEDLNYRDPFCRRIVTAYLDNRTGMSYGFLARQLPVSLSPAYRLDLAPSNLRDANWDMVPLQMIEGRPYAFVACVGDRWIVPVPNVSLLTTRSGCQKTRIDPKKDLICMSFLDGRVVVDTPEGISETECRPSYDTLVIFSHALGNAIIGSIMLAFDEQAMMPTTLSRTGLALTHWHGYLDRKPAGYTHYGMENPPVSCSTPQAAVYAFTGKLTAFGNNGLGDSEYLGDIHVEPHHGTNITGCMSLVSTAKWVDQCYRNNHPSSDSRSLS